MSAAEHDVILARARRANRGTRIRELLEADAVDSEDELAQRWKVRKRKRRRLESDTGAEDAPKQKASSADDSSSDSVLSDLDSSFQGSSSSGASRATESDFETASDSESGESESSTERGAAADRAERRRELEERAAAKRKQRGAEVPLQPVTIRARPKSKMSQAERLRRAQQIASAQSQTLADKETSFDNAEAAVREKATRARRGRRGGRHGQLREFLLSGQSEFSVMWQSASLPKDFGTGSVVVLPDTA
jgi:hypothetical protein